MGHSVLSMDDGMEESSIGRGQRTGLAGPERSPMEVRSTAGDVV